MNADAGETLVAMARHTTPGQAQLLALDLLRENIELSFAEAQQRGLRRLSVYAGAQIASVGDGPGAFGPESSALLQSNACLLALCHGHQRWARRDAKFRIRGIHARTAANVRTFIRLALVVMLVCWHQPGAPPLSVGAHWRSGGAPQFPSNGAGVHNGAHPLSVATEGEACSNRRLRGQDRLEVT